MFSPKKQLLKLVTRSVQVTHMEHISPCLRLVRLQGDGINKLSWSPGDKIKLHIESKMRSYTPSAINFQEQWMEVIIFLNGYGVASEWARNVHIGDETGFVGPSHSIPLPNFLPNKVLFLGDETTLGLACALFTDLPQTTSIEGAIEMGDQDKSALSTLNLSLDAALRTALHGEALYTWLTHWIKREAHIPFLHDDQAIIWLSGEAETVLTIKQRLVDIGISPHQFYSKPYWSIRGHRHRKKVQRQL